jgi:uncharacterized protein (UPF0264 family)
MNLLVSVRSAAEAEAALAGGAALIDVKEPSRGSLGPADDETVAAVLRTVAGMRPVSMALGELSTGFQTSPERQRLSEKRLSEKWTGLVSRQETSPVLFSLFSLAFAKWGLAGCRYHVRWQDELARAADRLPTDCRPVAVAYADWQRAAAPPLEDVCAFACARRWGAFLIDTYGKDGTTLLDWLSLDDLRALTTRCRSVGVPIALAGSLGVEQIVRLRSLEPDWFAVRGAVCRDGRRTETIDAERVRRMVDLLGEQVTAATPAG